MRGGVREAAPSEASGAAGQARGAAPAPATAGLLRRQGSLVPQRSIAGRSLVMVIAIMTFLACLAAGAAYLVARAVNDWTSSIASEMTIEVRPDISRSIASWMSASDSESKLEVASSRMRIGASARKARASATR